MRYDTGTDPSVSLSCISHNAFYACLQVLPWETPLPTFRARCLCTACRVCTLPQSQHFTTESQDLIRCSQSLDPEDKNHWHYGNMLCQRDALACIRVMVLQPECVIELCETQLHPVGIIEVASTAAMRGAAVTRH